MKMVFYPSLLLTIDKHSLLYIYLQLKYIRTGLFKTLEMRAVQSPAAKLTEASKFRKSEI